MSVTDLQAKRRAATEATQPLAEAMAQPLPVPDQYRITNPGVYDLIPAEFYHRDPVAGGSLSSTGAKRLVQPAGPARFKWALDHPDEKSTAAFDFGRVAHQVILGDFEDRVQVVDADSWRTKAAQTEAEVARAAGLTPILTKDWEKVQAMAEAVKQNRTAAKLLAPGSGKPEQTLVWQDETTGVMCRARVDWLRHRAPGRRLILADFKTTGGYASAAEFGKSSANYEYPIQAWLYSEGARALGLDPSPAFVFVVQEKEAPYLTNVLELTDEALNVGMVMARHAMRLYGDCTRTGVWPGYSAEIDVIDMPVWWLKEHDEDQFEKEATEV